MMFSNKTKAKVEEIMLTNIKQTTQETEASSQQKKIKTDHERIKDNYDIIATQVKIIKMIWML